MMQPGGGYGSGFVVALVGASADGEEAIALAGGRIGERIGWDGVPGEAATVLVVEAEGVADAVLADALPGLAAIADARGLAVVATIAVDQIDLVAAELLGARVILLCAPTLAERVAAVAVAAGIGDTPGFVREDERERLRRMNEEVARIAGLLARLVEAPDAGDGAVEDRRLGYSVAAAQAQAPVAAADVRRTIRARRMRAQYFDARLVEDPGWDMLLDLFASELERGQVSVSSLCIAAAVAPTTALRWISRMVAAGLFARMPDAGDKRRAFLVLTPAASAAMHGYADAVRRGGLPIV
jgi:hypothetical protein